MCVCECVHCGYVCVSVILPSLPSDLFSQHPSVGVCVCVHVVCVSACMHMCLCIV